MTIRETNPIAREKVNEEGVLSGRLVQAYNALYDKGPGTAREICQGLDEGLWKRFAELQKRGLVRTLPKRKCNVTGRHATVLDVTAQIPTPNPYFADRPSLSVTGKVKRRLTVAASKARDARQSALARTMSQTLFELEKELREIRDSIKNLRG